MAYGGPDPGQAIQATPNTNVGVAGPQQLQLQRRDQGGGGGRRGGGGPRQNQGGGDAVTQYSDYQRSGPPQVQVPYTTEGERLQQQRNQQFGTIGTDENGGAIRIMQDNTQYTPAPPIAGPSANTLPPAGAVPNTAPPGGLLDDRGVNGGGYGGGYGGRRGGPQRRLF